NRLLSTPATTSRPTATRNASNRATGMAASLARTGAAAAPEFASEFLVVDLVEVGVRDRPAVADDEPVHVVEHEGRYVRSLVRPVVVDVGVDDVAEYVRRTGVGPVVPDVDVVEVDATGVADEEPVRG